MSAQNKPVAVLISDIHFTPVTLELSSSALKQAQEEAWRLYVPLIIAGDLLDSKPIIRAECANRLIEMLDEGQSTYILVGNHDLINEKGAEHSLHFLKRLCAVIDAPTEIRLGDKDWFLLPYFSDSEKLKTLLKDPSIPKNIIMHQGVQTADMGHYVQDKTSLPKDCFSDFRVISGHYHRAQDIKCGRPRKGAIGLYSYIGSPYTTSFSEANDGPKGFRVLYEDGSLELIPTNLRKHVIVEKTTDNIYDTALNLDTRDLVWLKVSGPRLELDKIKKQDVAVRLIGHSNFKFDKIPTDSLKLDIPEDSLTEEQVLDTIIDNTDERLENKAYLKALWREVL